MIDAVRWLRADQKIVCVPDPETVRMAGCLRLLDQTRLPDEIVVFDDASTDDTVAILEEYKANNPHVVWDIHANKTNQGWRTNFKHALEQTSGDVIFLCDQDDIWMPDKLMWKPFGMEKH